MVRDAASAAKSLAGLVASVRADHVQAVVCRPKATARRMGRRRPGVPLTGWSTKLTGYPQVLPGGLAQAVGRDVDRRLTGPSGRGRPRGRGRPTPPYAALVLGCSPSRWRSRCQPPDPLVSFVDEPPRLGRQPRAVTSPKDAAARRTDTSRGPVPPPPVESYGPLNDWGGFHGRVSLRAPGTTLPRRSSDGLGAGGPAAELDRAAPTHLARPAVRRTSTTSWSDRRASS